MKTSLRSWTYVPQYRILYGYIDDVEVKEDEQEMFYQNQPMEGQWDLKPQRYKTRICMEPTTTVSCRAVGIHGPRHLFSETLAKLQIEYK